MGIQVAYLVLFQYISSAFLNFSITEMEIETGLPGQATFTKVDMTFVNGRTEKLSTTGANFISYSGPFNFN